MKRTMLKAICTSAFLGVICFANPQPVFADTQSDIASLTDQISVLQGQSDTLDTAISKKQEDLNNTNSEIEKRDKIIKNVDTQLVNSTERQKKDMKDLANQLSTKIIESQTKSLITGDNDISDITLHPLSFSLLKTNDIEVGQVSLENATLSETKSDIVDENSKLNVEKETKTNDTDTLIKQKADIQVNIENLQNQISSIQAEEQRKKDEAARVDRIKQKYGINISGTNSGVLETAFQFLGLPYVWGGTSPTNGFDCSGFTQYVYAQYGVYLPRTTYDQINCGTKVNGDLQPGDLIFPNVGHVQIYIGNGKVIHAPHTGDVIKISSLGNYISARRLI